MEERVEGVIYRINQIRFKVGRWDCLSILALFSDVETLGD